MYTLARIAPIRLTAVFQVTKHSALAQKLKAEIGEYLADAESAMTERDRLKRENERLKEKIKNLKGQ